MNNERGFTLVSALVAIVLLSIGFLAVSRTNAGVLRTQTEAAARTTALSIGRRAMEQVRGQDPATITGSPALAVDEEGQPDPQGAYTLAVEVTDVLDNLIEVVVLVNFPGGREPMELRTLTYVGAI